jgi:hypothetical protein
MSNGQKKKSVLLASIANTEKSIYIAIEAQSHIANYHPNYISLVKRLATNGKKVRRNETDN